MNNFTNKRMNNDMSYQPLCARKTSSDSGDDESYESTEEEKHTWEPTSAKLPLSRFEIALIVVHIILFFSSLSFFLASRHPPAKFWAFADPDPLYCKSRASSQLLPHVSHVAAPAQGSIEYQRTVLFGPFKDIDQNQYSGVPTPENNAAWEKLLAGKRRKIEASLLS